LRQHIEGLVNHLKLVQLALAHRADRRRGLHQIVARQRKKHAFGNGPKPMSRAAHPLEQHGEISRRADVADRVDVADIDAQLQRRGGHHDGKLTAFQFFFDFETGLARETAVVRADFPLAQALGQLVRHPLHQPARVDEDQRRAMRLDLQHELIVNRVPDILADDWTELLVGNFDAELHLALVADVDDVAGGSAVRADVARADQQARDFFDRLLRCAETDPLERFAGERIEALQRQSQMRAALVLGDRVDFIDDQRLGGPEKFPAAPGRE